MGYLDTWGDDGRTCTACHEFKPWDDFTPRATGKNGRMSACRACKAARKRARRAADPEGTRARERQYERQSGRHTRRRYGLDRGAWDAQVAAQGGRCAVPACNRLPKRRLVGDHCHVTGKFRGIICDNCNVAMGLTGDSPALLRALAEWLEQEGNVTVS